MDMPKKVIETELPRGDIKGFAMFVLKLANSVATKRVKNKGSFNKQKMMTKETAEELINYLWAKYKSDKPISKVEA